MKAANAIICTTLLVARFSYGDSARGPTLSLPTPTEEPTTDSPATSARGDETPARDPFTPYEVGSATTRVWRLDDLPKGEKTQASLGRNVQLHDATIEAYSAAVRYKAQRAAGDAAAKKLGIEHLELIGVVP